jgi:hypothetical protein
LSSARQLVQKEPAHRVFVRAGVGHISGDPVKIDPPALIRGGIAIHDLERGAHRIRIGQVLDWRCLTGPIEQPVSAFGGVGVRSFRDRVLA